MYLMAAVNASTAPNSNNTNSSSSSSSNSSSSSSWRSFRSSSSSSSSTTSPSSKEQSPGSHAACVSPGHAHREKPDGAGKSPGAPPPCRPDCYDVLEMDENDNSFPWGLIHHSELAAMLTAGLHKTLVIDSRSFLEYNTSTIQQAVNVCCSKLVKRRLQQDKVHILELLNQTCHTGAEASWDVVVYDQCTEDPALLTPDNFVHVLLRKLSLSFNSVAFLKGGFLAFQASHFGLVETRSSTGGGVYRCSTLTSLSQPCMPVCNVGPTRILPFLYLGSQQDSINPEVAQVNGISYILNVSKTCPRPPHILEGHFHRIPVNDNYCEKLLPFFQEAFTFLDKVREANGCVLVHCLGGVSRSATLAIAYIMKHMNMSSDEAYRYVKDKRPTISPNFNFLGQLLEFERVLKQEELARAAQRRALMALRENSNRDDPSLTAAVLEKASPVMMDLHTTSPSSPGPRSSQRSFAAELAPFSASVVPFAKCPFPSSPLVCEKDSGPSTMEAAEDSSSPLVSAAEDHNLPSSKLSSSARSGPGGHYDASPFPRPVAELCGRPATRLRNGEDECPFPGPGGFTPEVHRPGRGLPTPPSSQPSGGLPLLPSPVCPLTGFPSPAAASHEGLPESTCATTGFPGPGFPHPPSPSSKTGSSSSKNSPTSSPGLSRPQTLMFTDLHPSQRSTSSSSFSKSTTYQLQRMDTPNLPTSQPTSEQTPSTSGSTKGHQRKAKHGFSLSSMFSSFRWKSRPPSLPLSSPGTLSKDSVRKPTIQLTPVSEASETCDLNSSSGRSENTATSQSVSIDQTSQENCMDLPDMGGDCSMHSQSLDRDVVLSRLSTSATSLSMASTQINLLSTSSASLSSLLPSSTRPSSTSDPLPTGEMRRSRSLKLDPGKFTLSLSSPSSEFPVWTSVGPSHPQSRPGAHSPSDSTNKRKSASFLGFDGPDKLAKTELGHARSETHLGQHWPEPSLGQLRPHLPPAPPQSLGLWDGPAGRRQAGKPSALSLASPTAAMARLNFASPTSEALPLPSSYFPEWPSSSSSSSLHPPPSSMAAKNNTLDLTSHQSKTTVANTSASSSLSSASSPLPSQSSLATSASRSTHNRLSLPDPPRDRASRSSCESASRSPVDSSDLASRSSWCDSSPASEDCWSLSQSSWSGSDQRSSSMSTSSRSSASSSAMSCSFSEFSSSSSSSSSSSRGVRAFSEFPTTSLDKLNFTPCLARDIVQELKSRELLALTAAQQTKLASSSPTVEEGEESNPPPSALDSPMSISSGSSAPSLASSTLSPVDLVGGACPFSPSPLPPLCDTDKCPPTGAKDQSDTGGQEDGSIANISQSSTSAHLPGTTDLDHNLPALPPSDNARTTEYTSVHTYCETFQQATEPLVSPLSESGGLSPGSFPPQASVAPTALSRSPSCYSQCPSMEPLSPMSLSDSSSGSPVQSPVANGGCIPGPVYPSNALALTSMTGVVSSSLVHTSSSSSQMMTVAPTKVVLRRNRSKRGLDRPNSIAFSSYPACDLVSAGTGKEGSSPQLPSPPPSHDDMMGRSGKRLRPSQTSDASPHHQGRTSFGGYSEREVYRQISAAMETAMLQTQAYASSSSSSSSSHLHRHLSQSHASRKTRSLDNILDSGSDSEDLKVSPGGVGGGGSNTSTPHNLQRTRFGEHLFDQYRCGLRSGSEPYHSSSSLSSNGSHSSIHSSLEIIQLPR